MIANINLILKLWVYENHENCGVKNYTEDQRSYRRNSCSWEKKPKKIQAYMGIFLRLKGFFLQLQKLCL